MLSLCVISNILILLVIMWFLLEGVSSSSWYMYMFELENIRIENMITHIRLFVFKVCAVFG